ncbi:hypothetical protein Oscil6304_2980 [Oscillatoria acuminata PCC 6304]|uniref:Uncharacterized protein n=1 Tax=Oscillatoria acuminata PCC 6304 TaxID=56110 RepID=K9TJK0_9CYAN|nr:hypothetical protein Oscil6304_2980 [Oscillatoria acuminata PCC 6304]
MFDYNTQSRLVIAIVSGAIYFVLYVWKSPTEVHLGIFQSILVTSAVLNILSFR